MTVDHADFVTHMILYDEKRRIFREAFYRQTDTEKNKVTELYFCGDITSYYFGS